MIIQQASGVNAVLFYSARILTSVLPASAGVISVGITVVNALMTVPPIFLVDVSRGDTREAYKTESGKEDAADDFHGWHVYSQLCDWFRHRRAVEGCQFCCYHSVHCVSRLPSSLLMTDCSLLEWVQCLSCSSQSSYQGR
jgi:hypothetical protein